MSFDLDDPKLTAYALDELDEAECADVEARLANDPAAQRVVDEVRATAQVLASELAREELPAGINDGAPRTLRPLHWRIATVALAACLVVAVGVWTLTPTLHRAREVASNRSTVRMDPSPVPAARNAAQPPRTANTGFALDAASAPGIVASPASPHEMTRTNPGLTALADNSASAVPHDANDSVLLPVDGALAITDQNLELDPKKGFAVEARPLIADRQSPVGFDPEIAQGAAARERTVALERGEAAPDADVASQLEKRLPEIRLENSALGDVVDFFRDVSGTDIYVDWAELEIIGINHHTPVKLRMRDVKFSDALRGVLDEIQPPGVRLNIAVQDGVICISTRELPGNFNTEAYDRIVDNPFLDATQNPLSTFSIDVDTASYSNIRRFLSQGQLPPKDAVRIEEMVNYFTYDYAAPDERDGEREGGEAPPFSSSVEIASCPWNERHRLVRIGLKGREIAHDQRPVSNLVFLIDVSGSMQPANKLPLLKRAMKMLVDQLGENDRVAIVVYAGSSGLVLPSTSCDEPQKSSIVNALESLQSGGSTNGAQGIELAYQVATENFIKGGVNRVILCTDGDFNVGVTDQGALTRLIEDKAKTGVFLSVLGFGMGNVKDSTMEKLADKGNGNYAYIDTIGEARKVLVEQMSGTLVTIAKDVKIQVEFNPAQVKSYRLIGYENRMLAKEDFNDDAKDAGEIGAGHAVTALYEVVPAEKFDAKPWINATPEQLLQLTPEQRREVYQQKRKEQEEQRRRAREAARGGVGSEPVDPLRYQKPAELSDAAQRGEMLTLKLRYKAPDGDTSKPLQFPVKDDGKTFAQASRDFKFAASVAAFGMILRDSPHRGQATLEAVIELAEEGKGADSSGYRGEFIELVRKAKTLMK